MLLILISLIRALSVLLPTVPIFIIYNAVVLRRSRGADAGTRRVYVAATCAFFVALSAILAITGVPDAYSLRLQSKNLNFIPFIDILTSMHQYVLNVLLFLPVGFLLPVLWERFRRLRAVALAGFLLSLTIELLQLLSFRITDVDDLLMNTAGALLGYGIFALVRRRTPSLALGGDALRRWKCEPALYFACVWASALLAQPYVFAWIWRVVR